MRPSSRRLARLLPVLFLCGLLVVLVAPSGVWAADSTAGDADTATAGVQSTLALGTFAPEATISVTVGARITCVSNAPQHRHVNTGQTATWTIVNNGVEIDGNAVTPLAGSTTTVAVGPILAGDNFPTDGTACGAGPPTKDSTVAQNTTVNVAAPATCGNHTLDVDYGNAVLSPGGSNDSTSIAGQPDVSYTFSVGPCALNVSVGGTGTGVVHSTDNEIDCPDDADPGDCSHDYFGAPTVSFTATAGANTVVASVTGGASCSGVGTATASCTISMSQVRNVVVTFNLITWQLSVGVTGPGNVTSDVGGIDCPDDADPGDCSDTYTQPTVVTLTATPDVNHAFNGWTGPDAVDCAGGLTNPVCALTMTEQMNVTANFEWNVNVTVVGDGLVTANLGSISCTDAGEVTCSDGYTQSTVVTLAAAPDANWEFDGWSGDDAAACVSATPDVCALTMTEDRDVTATFSTIQHLVTVNVVGNGDVTADSGTIDCPDVDCDDLYDQASTVTLTATPDADHEFDGWSGDNAADCVSVTPDLCALTIDAAKSVTATFSTIQWDLNLTVMATGM